MRNKTRSSAVAEIPRDALSCTNVICRLSVDSLAVRCYQACALKIPCAPPEWVTCCNVVQVACGLCRWACMCSRPGVHIATFQISTPSPRFPMLHSSANCLPMSSVVSTQYTIHVTYRQTDRQTDRQRVNITFTLSRYTVFYVIFSMYFICTQLVSTCYKLPCHYDMIWYDMIFDYDTALCICVAW